jgi:hypothetical protein
MHDLAPYHICDGLNILLLFFILIHIQKHSKCMPIVFCFQSDTLVAYVTKQQNDLLSPVSFCCKVSGIGHYTDGTLARLLVGPFFR